MTAAVASLRVAQPQAPVDLIVERLLAVQFNENRSQTAYAIIGALEQSGWVIALQASLWRPPVTTAKDVEVGTSVMGALNMALEAYLLVSGHACTSSSSAPYRTTQGRRSLSHPACRQS